MDSCLLIEKTQYLKICLTKANLMDYHYFNNKNHHLLF